MTTLKPNDPIYQRIDGPGVTHRKPGSMQSRVISLLPTTRPEVVRNLNVKYGVYPSAVYRAISTLVKRGVISIDEYGVITRAGE